MSTLEYGGLLYEIKAPLSHVTSSLSMVKMQGSATVMGGLAAVMNTPGEFQIHHIIMSGYMNEMNHRAASDHPIGGLIGRIS